MNAEIALKQQYHYILILSKTRYTNDVYEYI